jgi:hypothetical protein
MNYSPATSPNPGEESRFIRKSVRVNFGLAENPKTKGLPEFGSGGAGDYFVRQVAGRALDSPMQLGSVC